MKLLITNIQPNEKFDGVIICPENGDNIYDLNKFVDHNECSEITCNVINYVPTQSLKGYIGELSVKLAHKGKLIILATDAIEVTKAFHLGRIDILTFNSLVYGDRTKVWEFRQSLVSLHDVVELMKLNGLKVLQKRLNEFKFSVIGERE